MLGYKGVSILRLNFSGTSYGEAWGLLRYFDAWIVKQAPDSVRMILDLGQFCYDPVFVMHCRKNMESYSRAVSKCAVLGASPFMLWLIRHSSQVGLFSRHFRESMQEFEFETAKEAKAWLIQP